jgi:hypothetical protein
MGFHLGSKRQALSSRGQVRLRRLSVAGQATTCTDHEELSGRGHAQPGCQGRFLVDCKSPKASGSKW